MADLEWYTVVSYDNQKIIVNVTLLKTHPLLLHEDARIFRWVSGIDNHPTMEKKDPRTIEERLQDMFSHYHITKEDWLVFTGFLLIPQRYQDSRYNMDKIIHVCLRIGIYNVNDMVPIKNPMTPKEDTYNEYRWVVKNCNAYTVECNEGWSVAGNVDSVLFYFRKKNKP